MKQTVIKMTLTVSEKKRKFDQTKLIKKIMKNPVKGLGLYWST
jgi:hypothetical protein